MDHYTLNPIVEASDFVKIRPDGLNLEELVDLNKRAHVLANRLQELSASIGFMSGPERNNLNNQIRKMNIYIATLSDLMSGARLAKMQHVKRSNSGAATGAKPQVQSNRPLNQQVG